MKRSSKLLSALLCGGLVIGCSEPAEKPAGSGSSSTAPAATSPATGIQATTVSSQKVISAPTDVDPILVGLLEDFEDLPAEFAELKSAFEADPTSGEAARDYIGTMEDLGIMQAQRGNTEAADIAFVRAGELLTGVLDAGVELDAGTMAAVVYYNHACVLGKQKNAGGALSLLNKSVEHGFQNLPQLKADEDLACVRDLPQWGAQVATWEAHFAELEKQRKEMIVKQAKEELAKGETFAFDFNVPSVNDEALNLKNFISQGQVLIIDVWGTWCPPCRQEIPSFVKLQDEYGKYGLQIIGLNSERGPSEEANKTTVKNFMANASMNYPCGLVTEDILKQLPELKGYPTTVFIDHTGKVRMTAVGLHDYEYLKAVTESLLIERTRAKRASTN